jgi:hypothetical protein
MSLIYFLHSSASSVVLVYNNSTSEIRYNTTKTFVIDHPINENKYLVHACLEGPESGVYYRGKGEIINNHSVTVILPDYVNYLATNLTVHLTSIYNGQTITKPLQYSEVENNSFTVYGENGKFSWFVYGKRSDIEVEPDKESVEVNGQGPYKWI